MHGLGYNLLIAFRNQDPNTFISLWVSVLGSNKNFALATLTYLRSPGNLINAYSKRLCRFILFLMSIWNNDIYKEYLPTYFTKSCWVDALHIYRLRVIWHQETEEPPNDHFELELLTNAILSGDKFAAKWAPNEKSQWNCEPLRAAYIIAKIAGMTMKEYRKTLTELRVDVLETQMSQGRYGDIQLSDIPKSAWYRNKNALGSNKEIRNRILEFDGPPKGRSPYFEAVCVIDNTLTCVDGWNFISWVTNNSYYDHFRGKVINMGEYIGLIPLSDSDTMTNMLLGGSVLNLRNIYEFLLGQALIYDLNELPKTIFVVTDIPLRKEPDLSGIVELYAKHMFELPETIYINLGNLRGPKLRKPITVHGLGEISIGLALREIGITEPFDGVVVTKDYTNVSKIFFW